MKSLPVLRYLRALLACGFILISRFCPAADGLDTWHLRNPVLSAENLSDVIHDGSQFVAVGANGMVQTSPDGVTWTVRHGGSFQSLGAVAFGNGRYVVVSDFGGTALMSLDGVNWTNQAFTSTNLRDVTYGNGIFVAVGSSSPVKASADGLTWTNAATTLFANLRAITFANGRFVTVGENGVAYTSSNAVNWTLVSLASPGYTFNDVTYGNGLFVAVGGDGRIVTSPTGVNWTPQNSGTFEWISTVAYGNGQFVAMTFGAGLTLTSTNGLNWSSQLTASGVALYGLAYGNGTFVSVGDNGTVLTASDPSAPDGWMNRSSVASGQLNDVAFGHAGFVAAGQAGAIVQSPDGTTWTRRSPATGDWLTGVAYGAGTYVVVGEGRSFTSEDGIVWINRLNDPNVSFQAVAYGPGGFVAVGGESDPLTGAFRGGIYGSADGRQWTRRDSGNAPEAWGAVGFGGGRFVAMNTYSDFPVVATSTDGVNWSCHSLGTNIYLSGLVWANGVFVAMGQVEVVATSRDGVAWSVGNSTSFQDVGALAYGEGQFVAVGIDSISTSTSGLHWTNRPVTVSPYLTGVAYGAGTFVVVGSAGTILQSNPAINPPDQPPLIIHHPDPRTERVGGNASFGVEATGSSPFTYQWRKNGAAIPGETNAILFLPKVGPADAGVYSSAVSNAFGGVVSAPASLSVIQPNPLDSWQLRDSGLTLNSDFQLNTVAFGNGLFVAMGPENVILTSPNGVTWSRQLPPRPFSADDLVFGPGRFVVIDGFDDFFGDESCLTVLSSVNGVAWTNEPVVTPDPFVPPCVENIRGIAFGAGRFVAVGYDSILMSTNGRDWTASVWGVELGLRSVTFGGGRFVAVGGSDFDGSIKLVSSADGIGWTYGEHDLPPDDDFGTLNDVAYGDGRFVVTGLDDRVLVSTDGMTWETHRFLAPFFGARLGALAYGGGQFVAAADADFGLGSALFSSADGAVWTPHSAGEFEFFGFVSIRDLAYGNNTFVAVGAEGLILQSDPLAPTAPAMVRQPRSRTVALGSYFTLNAAVTGSSPLVYEWYKDGTLLCTSPKSDLYVESAQLYDAGNYQVVVRNAYGTATSVTARITVEPEQPVLTASIDETGNAVLTILGRAGARYRIECADSIAEESPVWRTVATVTATTNPFSWADATAVFFAHRFYRVAEDEVVFP